MIEVHNHPDEALSDGAQSLYPDQFAQTMKKLTGIRTIIESS
jgi:3-deoxy-7-phosphoheptulonate synthase